MLKRIGTATVFVALVLVGLTLASCQSKIVDTRFAGLYTCSQSGKTHRILAGAYPGKFTGYHLRFGNGHNLTLNSDGSLSVDYFRIPAWRSISASPSDQHQLPSTLETCPKLRARGEWWFSNGDITIRLTELNLSIVATPSPLPEWSARSSEEEQTVSEFEDSRRILMFDDDSKWEWGVVSPAPLSVSLPQTSVDADLKDYMHQIRSKIADAVDRIGVPPAGASDVFSQLTEDLHGNPEVQSLLWAIITAENELMDDGHRLAPEQLEANLLEDGALIPRLSMLVEQFLGEMHAEDESAK